MEMTLTRVLVELKTLDKRIMDKIQSVQLLDMTQKKYAGKTLGSKIPIQDFVNREKAEYQSIKDLMEYQVKLKSALFKANSETIVQLIGQEMTITEVIEFKRSHIKTLDALYTKLVASRSHIMKLVDQNRLELDNQVANLVEKNTGKDKKIDKDDFEKISAPFIEANRIEIVDAIGIDKEIETLKKKIEDFKKEVDIVLSEVNSRTVVVI